MIFKPKLAKLERTQSVLDSGNGITYNETGLAYNQSNQTYGGITRDTGGIPKLSAISMTPRLGSVRIVPHG